MNLFKKFGTLPLTALFVFLTLYYIALFFMDEAWENLDPTLSADLLIGGSVIGGIVLVAVPLIMIMEIFYEWLAKRNELIAELSLGGIYLLWGFLLSQGFLYLS